MRNAIKFMFALLYFVVLTAGEFGFGYLITHNPNDWTTGFGLIVFIYMVLGGIGTVIVVNN